MDQIRRGISEYALNGQSYGETLPGNRLRERFKDVFTYRASVKTSHAIPKSVKTNACHWNLGVDSSAPLLYAWYSEDDL